LQRKKAFGGSFVAWYVAIDGNQVGSLKNGESLTVTQPKAFTVEVGGAVNAREAVIRVGDKQNLEFLLSLGAMSIKAKQLR
jgi:predicted deacylase